MSAPNDLKLIDALDALSAASDLVEGINLAALGLGNKNERGAIARIAEVALSRIEKAERKIYRYREKCEEPAGRA
jgi:hypothetical protein